MKFEEVLQALRDGKKITSKYLKECGYQYIYYRDKTMFENKGGYWHLTNCELIESDDWEVVKETKKVKLRDLTEEQFTKWVENYCAYNGAYCGDCLFKSVNCVSLNDTYWIKRKNNCWLYHKDLYSDKFLDQEIEVED